MARFSIARAPYYLCIIVFMICVAIEAYISNTYSVGILSDVYLLLLVVALVMGGLSVVYLNLTKSELDDEVDAEIAGFPVGKKFYYGGVMLLAAWRFIAGFEMNHNLTGIYSTYGLLWVLASVAVAGFTYANYRSYSVKTSFPRV